MKVHFVGSRESLENDLESLRKIAKAIESTGHSIARDWLKTSLLQLSKSGRVSDNWGEIVKVNIEVIAQADVVIAETSYDSFAVGYLIAMAVQQKKPILLLRRKNADQDAFVTGVEAGWVKHGEYDDNNLGSIIEKFLEDNNIQLKDMRFNFFIDRPIYNYLRWSALKTGKTKAEILRELVVKEIENQVKST